ncbi:uncharacterized protein LOC126298360 [Schistocerca gregaria]|uniref:uncharacterized protein LOC126298360 n=1 Tax=Schistocerca gregaria TaxID=7010 RepID=UPI00211F0108|nr:uncharacterized protein LOC126298360 [Schistocerca gregaria]
MGAILGQSVACVLVTLLFLSAADDRQRRQHGMFLYQTLFSPPQPARNPEQPSVVGRSNSVLCDSPDGTTGVCYPEEECEQLGGLSLASCDDQHRVCCLVEKSCRNVTSEVVSYFVNPSYPNPDRAGTFCDFRIDVLDEDICQVRMDFEQFSLSGPHRTLGICRNDRFIVTTSLPNGIGLSELCGENGGQHIYVPVDAAIGSASVSIMIMTSGIKPYQWRIRATQINCKENVNLAAPQGCLQYYTELSGSIQSFNYYHGQGHYQSNLDYSICILRSPNTCRVEYRQVEDSIFWINSADSEYLEENIGRAGTASCDLTTHDYLHIPDGRGATSDDYDDETQLHDDPSSFSTSSSDKFCGRSLSGLAVIEEAEHLKSGYVLDPPENTSVSSAVTSFASGPIVLRFHSDDVTEPEKETGFHITYKQLGTGCMRSLR